MASATNIDTRRSVFDRVVVGVDGTDAAFEACRQVHRLAGRDAAVEAAAVVHLGPSLAETLAPGVGAAQAVDQLQGEADEALARAVEILGPRAERRCLNGFVVSALLDETRRFDATLLAIGTHGHRRAAEIAFGGPAGELIHRAHCSVLVARRADPATFPRAVVVGYNGSGHSADALAVARQLAARCGCPLRVVAATSGDAATELPVEAIDGPPVQVLVDAARDADLLVVGSRGLRGLKALGSVSERVAHQAGCSVLVVHPTC